MSENLVSLCRCPAYLCPRQCLSRVSLPLAREAFLVQREQARCPAWQGLGKALLWGSSPFCDGCAARCVAPHPPFFSSWIVSFSLAGA